LRRTTLAALAAATLLLAGCGDDGEPQADPSGTPTGSATSEAADPTPTEPGEPAVEPASGFLIDLDRITMRVPDGWKKVRQFADFLVGAQDPGGFSNVSLGDLSAVGEPSLEEQAEFAAKSESQTRILEPVEIAGAQWYHIVGREDRYVGFEQFGTVHNGSQATISFSLDDKTPADEQQAIIASVLATVEWK
jgi:hypothetical protein